MTLYFRVSKLKAENLTQTMPHKVISCFLLAISLHLSTTLTAQAGDFSKAKKVYVPPSQIDRRVDFASMREGTSVPSKLKKGSVNKTVKAPAAKSSAHPQASKPSSSANSTAKSLPAKVSPAMISSLKQKSRGLIQSGHLDEAQKVLTKINQLSPQDKAAIKELSSVSLKRAQRYIASDDFQSALTATRQALSAEPKSPEAQKLLNELYRKAGVDPANVGSRLSTATNLYNQTRYHEAEVEYKSSLAIQPTADAHVGLGKVAEKLRGSQAAKMEYEKALELDPNSSAAHRELGLLHHNAGDLVGANSELSRALILNSQDKESGQHLIKLWQNQVSKLPTANSHLGLARAYQLSGDLPAAQAEYRQVVQLEPNHPYLPAARQSFKSAIARQVADKNIKTAQTFESQGLLNEAFQQANEAVRLHPGNMNNRLYQGALLEKLGQAAQAQQVYMAILKDDPTNSNAINRLRTLPADQLAAFPGSNMPMTGAPGAPQVDQVGQLSNFVGSLRNQMVVQKNQFQRVEGDAQQTLNSMGTGRENIAESFHSPVAPSDDYVSKILASPVGSPLPPRSNMMSAPGQISANSAPPISFPQQPSSLRPAIPSNSAYSQNLPPATNNVATTNPPLRFELKQINPTHSNVQLKVVLKNESDAALKLPNNLKAIIRYPNNQEADLRIDFDGHSVPGHGSIDGIVRVPLNKVDPAADIVLRDISPLQQNQDLHLVTAVSQR